MLSIGNIPTDRRIVILKWGLCHSERSEDREAATK